MEEKRRDSNGTPPPPAVASEAPAPEQPTSRRRGGGHKRKSTSLNSGGGSSNPQSSSKRQTREKPPVVPFSTIHMNGPLTRARLQPNSSNSFSQTEVPVKSEVEAQEAAARAEEISKASQNWEALEAHIEAEYDSIRTRDASVHVVPVHAGWFSWKNIHPLEKRMLPSFFNGRSDKRTPEAYMEIRNWVMKKFHLDPSVNVEVKHLSELTVGESDARQEVIGFLEYWGLINYHPFLQYEPAAMNVDLNADVTKKTDLSAEKLFKFETVQSWSPVVPRMNTSMPAMSSGLLPESVIADELVKSEGPSVEYHCNSCSADCSRRRYHCQKQADFDLCAECFNNGMFGSNMSPSDFILMEPAEAGGVSGGKWTDQETLLLLEAIELFRDNWSEIAEHVATKTKAQCILHFVQMPIEDAFFNHDDENNTAPKENGLPVCVGNEDLSAKADQERDADPKDAPEQKESHGGGTDNQALSCPMGISKEDDVSESDMSHEVTDSFALKALKEAFEAVGALPPPDERLSFAEAGNPVMTLAAFLIRLVDPNIAIASARSLLKSLSSYQSGSHLAARHCFRLEDPPDEEKNIADSEGAPNEKNDLQAEKHEGEHVPKENANICDPFVDKVSPEDDNSDKNKEKKDSASEDQKPIVPSSEFADESDCLKESDGIAIAEAQPTSTCEPSSSDISKKRTSKVSEESVVSAAYTDTRPNIVKEPKDGASSGEHSQSKESVKDEEMISNSEEKEIELFVMSNSITEKEKDTGDVKDKECDNEKKETPATKNDLEIDKLKRVAVTALSAAAVKAKLLADHEEDQIRQLATFLIEKQLYKLEAKLAFFNDLENLVMWVKEQLDRLRQRNFHERAQILARFGMSASGRPNSQMAPQNRAAAAAAAPLPNQGPRPLTGTNSMRPLV